MAARCDNLWQVNGLLVEALNKPSLLLIEDDPALSLELAEYLRGDGFDVQCASTVHEAEIALTRPFDLLVLDLNLPDGSGVELCNRLRPYIRSGIVICSGRSERSLRFNLLRSGADAYLVKPVDPEELSATLASVLRRVGPAPSSPMQPPSVPAMWRLDRVQQSLEVPSGDPVSLTAPECLLLATLFVQPERFAERQQLLEIFTKQAMPMNGPRLETLVSRLRAKVFSERSLRLPLRAWYGRGYSFAAHAELI